MWKKTLAWNNDSIEFMFKDQVDSIEESIQGDKMRFRATMKNGNQIKEVELRMTIKTVSEENNNPDREKKQEYHEQGSLLDSIKLEEELPDDPRVESELSSEKEESVEKMTEKREGHHVMTEAIEVKEPDAKKKRKGSDLDTSSEDLAAIIQVKSRKKNEIEAHLLMSIEVIFEDAFFGHQGNDLFDPEIAAITKFRIKKSATLKEFLNTVAKYTRIPVEKLRPWPLLLRTNQTLRPSLVEIEDEDRSMVDVAENCNPWTIFMELLKADNDLRPATNELQKRTLATFDENHDVILFFKYYCPRTGRVHYMGHLYLALTTKLNSVLPKLCDLASIPTDSELILWEEIKPNMLERIEDTNQPLEQILEELMDGDIIVFQKDPGDNHNFELPTAKDYFRDLFYKVKV